MPLRGSALLVENAISWLASKPQVLDVPDRTAVPAGIRITDDDRAAVRRDELVPRRLGQQPASYRRAQTCSAHWRGRVEGFFLRLDAALPESILPPEPSSEACRALEAWLLELRRRRFPPL